MSNTQDETNKQPDSNEPVDKTPPSGESNPQPEATTGKPESTPAPEKKGDAQYVFNGNWDELEEKAPGLVPYAKQLRRYLTEKTEGVSEIQKKLEQYESALNDPRVQKALSSLQDSQNQDGADDEDLLDPDVKAAIKRREDVFRRELETVRREMAVEKKKAEIESFATAHPDFWDFYNEGLISKGTIAQFDGDVVKAYTSVKNAIEKREAKIREEAKKKLSNRIQEKKDGVTVGSTPSSQDEFIYVDSPKDINRAAFEAAYRGENKRVKVRKPSR